MPIRPMTLPTLLLVVLAAACTDAPPPPERPVRPVEAILVSEPGVDRVRTFSGTVEANTTVELSFRVSGQLVKVNVNVGDILEKGDTVAVLDRTDFELKTREAQASLTQAKAEERNARANYTRMSDLYENQSVSLTDLDAARAQAESRKATVRSLEQGLALAEKQLEYTTLLAPQRMAVTQVIRSDNENVKSGDPVAIAVYGERPEVKVVVPESLISPIRRQDRVEVRFDAIPGEIVGAEVTEVGVAATQGGATYPVTVRLDDRDSRLRAGMAAKVDFRFSTGSGGRLVVPAYAVGHDREGHFVYVLEPGEDDTATTSRVGVTIGELTAHGLEIISGLSGGEIIASAGVPRIRGGMKVRVLRTDL